MECRRLLWSLILGLVCGLSCMLANATVVYESPVGYWKVTDKTTGEPKSIVKIWQTPDNQLMGTVIKVFNTASNQTATCTACKGAQHNQPLVGMVILSGMKQYPTRWSNGKILNPENGKTYSCAIQTLDHGQKLKVRDYIGLPLLGFTETWERVDLMSS